MFKAIADYFEPKAPVAREPTRLQMDREFIAEMYPEGCRVPFKGESAIMVCLYGVATDSWPTDKQVVLLYEKTHAKVSLTMHEFRVLLKANGLPVPEEA